MERRHGLTLAGNHVRLEPLALGHVPALVAAANEDPSSFRFSTAPDNEPEMSAWIQDTLAAREAGRELPFAIYSYAHERIVGSTRFYELERWRLPPENPQRDGRPDACMIGYTWLGASAQRTACNTEAKLLMLSHAFETWACTGSRSVSTRVTIARGWRSTSRSQARGSPASRANRRRRHDPRLRVLLDPRHGVARGQKGLIDRLAP